MSQHALVEVQCATEHREQRQHHDTVHPREAATGFANLESRGCAALHGAHANLTVQVEIVMKTQGSPFARSRGMSHQVLCADRDRPRRNVLSRMLYALFMGAIRNLTISLRTPE